MAKPSEVGPPGRSKTIDFTGGGATPLPFVVTTVAAPQVVKFVIQDLYPILWEAMWTLYFCYFCANFEKNLHIQIKRFSLWKMRVWTLKIQDIAKKYCVIV